MKASTMHDTRGDNGGGRPYRVGLIGTGIMGTNHAIGYMLNRRRRSSPLRTQIR